MKNITGKTLIFYTFQQSPKSTGYNVTTFKKSAPQEPKIRDILYELPLDYQDNSFHFRFKSEFFQGDEKIIGWIDISNLLAKVPIVNNNIFVKILQLPGDRENKLFNKEKLKAIGLLDPKGNSPMKTVNAGSGQPKVASNGVNSGGSMGNIGEVKKNDKNIFDMDQSPKKVPTPTSATLPNPSSNKKQSPTKETKPDPAEKPYIPGSETPQQRLKHFKNQIKKQQQQRQLQKKAIIFHEQKLTEWGYSGHKTINNLTTLLATLHQIWPEWQPVSLSDMLKPEDVTALYKKAVVRLHPDKNHNKDYQTKYLAKRIFELLNQARKAATQN